MMCLQFYEMKGCCHKENVSLSVREREGSRDGNETLRVTSGQGASRLAWPRRDYVAPRATGFHCIPFYIHEPYAFMFRNIKENENGLHSITRK